MKINFKKISAITGSALMVGMTMGVAAAANYPAPFVSGGAANVAIVYGTGSGVSILDAVEAGSIQSNLQTYVSGSSGSVGGSVTGEAVALFTGGTKLYINDKVNTVKSVITKSDLPTILNDESFSGDVDATASFKIDLGSTSRLVYKKQPTTSDDPVLGWNLSTSQANYLYNATATFTKGVNFSNADSEGNTLTLLGTEFTVGSATDTDTLVLLKSAEKLDLTSDAPTASATVGGATYTIELISASDTAATVKVTNAAGVSESKEIDEAASKKVNGITIAVNTADETNLRLSASIIAGADKMTLEDGVTVKLGEDDAAIDGTLIDFGTGNPNNLTTLTISVFATESDKDAIKIGEAFVDPVFGSFKVDFAGVNIDTESTARETISFAPSGDDKMQITFTNHGLNEKSFTWAVNESDQLYLAIDTDGRNLTTIEGPNSKTSAASGIIDYIHYNEYVVVGNEDEGYLLKLSAVSNQTSDTGVLSSSTKIEFTDVFSGDTYRVEGTSITAAGVGTISIGGKSYTATAIGPRGSAQEVYNVSLNYPDSSAQQVILYPTIQTGKGAKVSFYEPLMITLNNSFGNAGTNISAFLLPDGDGYTTVSITQSAGLDGCFTHAGNEAGCDERWNIGGKNLTLNTTGQTGVEITVGELIYNFTNKATAGTGLPLTQINETIVVYLTNPGNGGNILLPAVVIWEEKDDNNEYHALTVELDATDASDDDIGIDSIEDTFSNESGDWENTRASDSKIEDSIDLWGTIVTTDSGDSDQKVATISYPDEQIYAELYVAANDATITAGTVSGGGAAIGDVLVKDSEVSSVSTKNLVVVGGSCINSVAANLVDAGCGSGWTDATGVGSGQFLIQSFGDAYSTGKIALLVAGYEVSDTVNAAKYLRTQTVMTDSGKKYIGTSSTSATLQTTETTA